MECIILAGGLGTRLRNTIGDAPKCMAPVNDRPFIQYLLTWLEQQGCTRVVLSLGYKHEVLTDWLTTQHFSFAIDFVIEHEPLGTGGGIRLALQQCTEHDVIVLNGDTFFDVPLNELLNFHLEKTAATTLALKPMKKFERYGSVHTDAAEKILSFEEKQYKEDGLINGGVYVIDRAEFLTKMNTEKFSFEKDYLEAFVREENFYGKRCDGYFIDIGIPEDYYKAQEDFKQLFG